MNTEALPVVVIGAGPVGLAAAAHLLERGLDPLVLEQGSQAGASVAAWGHVRFFSPWRYSIDQAAQRLLASTSWEQPDPDTYPTGKDLVDRYLRPLSEHPQMKNHIRYGNQVTSVTRFGFDKMKSPGRDEAPFLVTIQNQQGEATVLARAVIDASGTWNVPNAIGASGRPAIGESALKDRIVYGIPNVLGQDKSRYAGKRILVVGSGHSAFNVLLDLVALADEFPTTDITWAIRKPAESTGNLFGGGINDALPARGELGSQIKAQVEAGRLRLVTGARITRIDERSGDLVASGIDTELPPVDEIIGATGFRPNLDLLSELRLSLDPAVEAPTKLAPLIDPNLHSCGSVPPHGAEELMHPDADVYIVGMKSYGRAPTFLMLTGYEQVRSVAAALAGDWDAARDVQLVLPQTGVCSSSAVLGERGVSCCGTEAEGDCCGETTQSSTTGCCGDTAPQVIQLSTITRGGCCS